MSWISTHEGPCCLSCLQDQAGDFGYDYYLYNEYGDQLCCCYELKRPAA